MSAQTPDKQKKSSKNAVKDLVFTAMFAALIAVCSILSIPIGEVPITLQTFAVCLAAAMLGWKRGTLSVLIYVLLGAVGVPVFAGMTGGVGILAGPTGGYII
ncbi:MAG: biotin transporter BioY, partial [Ruminococcus sp.]|nr:biotin transporter BioY [Ruminococcus sp.]